MAKALTPLTATLILIGFSFVIGTVVMAWGEKYIEDRAEFVQGAAKFKGSCEGVKANVYSMNGVDSVCFANYVFNAILENGPNMVVEDVQVKLIGSKNVYTQDGVLDKPLERFAVQQVSFVYPDIGVPKQVKLSPKILVNGNIVFCPDKSTVVSKFDCSWK
ncbi:hypothetical protein HY486_00990 [Candidatus Woesearchaeota archaeon]|nr:hypothetical protein [Candidatus Woesearchaeota archaeon]